MAKTVVRAEDEAREKLYAIKLLRLLAKRYSSKTELADRLGISLENISRYLSGRVLPTTERKRDIINFALSGDGLSIPHLIEQHIHVSADPLRPTTIDNTHLLNDSKVLDAISFMLTRKHLNDIEYSKVVTVAVDGLPFAKALAAVRDIDMVYARRKPPVLIEDVLTTEIWPGAAGRQEDYNPKLYLPRSFIRPGEKVVIVDDVIRTGATLRALIKLVRDAGAEPQVAIALAGIDEWRTGYKLIGLPLHVLRRYT